MSELMIKKGMIIDCVENVVTGIELASKEQLYDLETVKKFILSEKNTIFYVDRKGLCKLQPDSDADYAWLDTGYTDAKGNALFISLRKDNGEFVGHIIGTAMSLAKCMKEYFKQFRKQIDINIQSFINSYSRKIDVRVHKHIGCEQEYLLASCTDTPFNTPMDPLLQGFVCDSEETVEEIEEETVISPLLNEEETEQEEITIGLLCETIENMQGTINSLIRELEQCKEVSRTKIEELESKNEEYMQVLLQIRNFNEGEKRMEEFDEDSVGHELLGNHKKILVFGSCGMEEKVMIGIAKEYGFTGKDFEFETDYKKLVGISGRVQNAERYAAIILGACPHKVAGLGDYSSLCAKLKQNGSGTLAIDARSKSGELKVTKESFRNAIVRICEELSTKFAA